MRLLPGSTVKGVFLMRTKRIGLIVVVGIAVAIIAYKAQHPSSRVVAHTETALPRVLLVADLGEANRPGDACAEIIHQVRAAHARGIAVQELEPGRRSELLTRYHVLTTPTVLILGHNGQVVSRFEGEGAGTVRAVQTELAQLR